MARRSSPNVAPAAVGCRSDNQLAATTTTGRVVSGRGAAHLIAPNPFLGALTLPEKAQVAAACFAALAALASWSTVALSRKVWLRSLAPRLRGSARWPPNMSDVLELTMANSGKGFASDARFLLLVNGSRVEGKIGPTGFLDAADQHTIRVRGVPSGSVRGILFCLDSDSRWHVWSWNGRDHHVPRVGVLRRPPKVLDPVKQFEALHFGVLIRDVEPTTFERVP